MLIGRCSSFLTDSGLVAPLDETAVATLESIKNTYSSQGKRCLILAQKTVSGDELSGKFGTSQYEETIMQEAKTGLTLIGLVAIVDPLRPEIPEVVTTLRAAGIRIAMVCILFYQYGFLVTNAN